MKKLHIWKGKRLRLKSLEGADPKIVVNFVPNRLLRSEKNSSRPYIYILQYVPGVE